MLTRYYQKNKESFQKSVNVLVSDIEIFLKKKKRKNVNMVVKDIKNF